MTPVERMIESFEAFAQEHYALCECPLDDDGEEYEDPDVQYAWEIFEYAYNSGVADCQALAKATGVEG